MSVDSIEKNMTVIFLGTPENFVSWIITQFSYKFMGRVMFEIIMHTQSIDRKTTIILLQVVEKVSKLCFIYDHLF